MKAALTVKNNLTEIERLADWVLDFGRDQDLQDDLVWELRLVLEELVTNIISYGYADTAEHTIAVSMTARSADIIVRIQDDAGPFNLLEHPLPDLDIPYEDREIGGMGIHMIRKIMDEISYTRKENGNLLVLKRCRSLTAC